MDSFKCIKAYENHYEGHMESSELYRGSSDQLKQLHKKLLPTVVDQGTPM